MRLRWSDHKWTVETHQRSHKSCPYTVNASTMCPADNLCSDFVISASLLSLKQPSRPALMTYFPATATSGMHQDPLAFTLQKIFDQMHPRPPQQVVWVIRSQYILHLYKVLFSDFAWFFIFFELFFLENSLFLFYAEMSLTAIKMKWFYDLTVLTNWLVVDVKLIQMRISFW